MRLRTELVLTLITAWLSACADISPESRAQTALAIATAAHLQPRQIATDPFTLTVFERVSKQNAAATIYIEGDGLAWLSYNEPSLDPTPTDPLTLRLAAQDPGDNVIYMARPCQFTAGTVCKQDYWTSRRLSPEELTSANAALDDIKTRYRIAGFHLVGYSGGGGVAALLAGMRDDALSLRTVAGNLNPSLFARLHHVSPPADVLSPLSVAAKTARIPQQHFVGSEDRIVPPALFESFRKAIGPSSCVRTTRANASHKEGWVQAWPSLLNAQLDCNAP